MNSPHNPDVGTTEDGEPRPWYRRHRWLAGMAALLVCVVAAMTAMALLAAHRFEPYLRQRIVDELQQSFHAKVELAEFHVTLHHGQEGTWGLWATGRGLRISPALDTLSSDQFAPPPGSIPLFELNEFSFHVPLRYEMASQVRLGRLQLKHFRIKEVRLRGLTIAIPPASQRNQNSGLSAAFRDRNSDALSNVTVDKVECAQAQVILLTDKPGKLPLSLRIPQLTLTHLQAGRPIDFTADILNPRPQGAIHTTGSFGPIATGDPGESPLRGNYLFQHADLSVFHGIAGILESTGTFSGTLRTLEAMGRADVPDFRLSSFGNAFPLKTRFHARVDATSGDTWLDQVDATLGHSHFTTRGKVVRVLAGPAVQTGAGRKPDAHNRGILPPSSGSTVGGHIIDLEVNIDRGNMAEFLLLASRSAKPLLTGAVTAQASLHIPPGPDPIHLRMNLDGRFSLHDAQFTNTKAQAKVEELSRRGQGRPNDAKAPGAEPTRSQMAGEFHMARGIIALPALDYSLPGAKIQLAGFYSLQGPMQFDGTARLQATVSQMVGGWKGFLLKPLDPVFRSGGTGTLVPIRVRGTREEPEFGVDLGRLGHTSPQRPGGP